MLCRNLQVKQTKAGIVDILSPTSLEKETLWGPFPCSIYRTHHEDRDTLLFDRYQIRINMLFKLLQGPVCFLLSCQTKLTLNRYLTKISNI